MDENTERKLTRLRDLNDAISAITRLIDGVVFPPSQEHSIRIRWILERDELEVFANGQSKHKAPAS